MASALAHYGLAVLFAALLADSFALPLPGETMLVAAGVMAGEGKTSLLAVILVGSVAAAIGNGIGFEIGRRGGPSLIALLARRARIDPARIERFRAIAERRGAALMIVARFVPLLRETSGLVAGAAGLDRTRYWIANAVGAVLWVTTIALLAFEFGQRFHVARFIEAHIKVVAAAVLAAFVIAALVRRWRSPGPSA